MNLEKPSKNFGNWSNALYTAILAARLGREVLLKYIGRLENIERKFQSGLVSEADKESEKIIFDHLRKYFPNDEFLGEESAYDKTKVESPKHGTNGRWIVDPLDGTTNYIHQFPVFCVSIGYEVDGKTQVAVIDVPALGEVYTAVRGYGAFVNGRPLRVSQTTEIGDAFLATGFMNEIEVRLQEQLHIFGKIVREARAVRRAGAAAYDLALVARGVFDGYWERGLYPWDAAAGILLVEEAGGKISTYRGNEYHPYKNTIIAGNPIVVDKLVATMASHIAEDAD
jgi:myo-inositol-1(or 4)-monophosphatase